MFITSRYHWTENDQALPSLETVSSSVDALVGDESTTVPSGSAITAGVEGTTRRVSPRPPPGVSVNSNLPIRSPASYVPQGPSPTSQRVPSVVESPVATTPVTPAFPMTLPAAVGPASVGKVVPSSSSKDKVAAVVASKSQPSATAPAVTATTKASDARDAKQVAKTTVEAIQKAQSGTEPLMRFHPGKLNLAEAVNNPSKEAAQAIPPKSSRRATAASGPTPSNATAAALRDHDFPARAPSQPAPRTLRVVSTPSATARADLPPPIPVASAVPSPIARNPSRQPSLASLGTNRPATPHSVSELTTSDGASFTSASISRANSPPLPSSDTTGAASSSRVGSAPVRQQTKSQLKKQRKETKREMEKRDMEEAAAAAAAVEAEGAKRDEEAAREIAPIVGRKKKVQKVKKSGASTPSTTAARPASPAPATKDVKAAVVAEPTSAASTTTTTPAPPVKTTKKAKSNPQATTVETPTPPTVAGPSSEPTTPPPLTAASILTSLSATLETDLSSHPFFKVPASHAHPHPSKPYSDRVPVRPLSLSAHEHALLVAGHAVHQPARSSSPTGHPLVSDRDPEDDTLLLTPSGYLVRNLSPGDETRFLSLEHAVRTHPDTTAYTPPRCGFAITPVEAAPPSAGPAKSSFYLPPSEAAASPASATAAASQPLPNPLATSLVGRISALGEPSTTDPDAFTMQVGQTYAVGDIERALGMARRETEAMEKRLVGLVRRNRRVGFPGLLG